jgi:TM2 domain-containing membrane protein YozV
MSTEPDTPTPESANAPPAPETAPEAPPAAETPPPAPATPPAGTGGKSDKKLIAGLLGILLGSLGIHKFYLGYQKEGIIMLVISVATCGFAAAVSGIIGLIEGILYLTKTDEEFDATYVTGRKPWF